MRLKPSPLLLCLLSSCLLTLALARRIEVYGFSIAETPTFRGYDWSVLTTSAWRVDPELLELANKHDARVEINAGHVADVMKTKSSRKDWARSKVVEIVKSGAKGINFDLEIPLQAGSQEAADYAAIVEETANQLHTALPGASVSVDVPWSPFDVDGRNYDWNRLAAAADLLFIMAYDTQSQILGRCIAGANSPIDAVRKGVRQWLSLGIPAKKLVLGLPWYGYDYQCEGPDANTPAAADVDLCVLKAMEFQNVSCSDAVGAQKCYWEIMAMLHPKHAVNTTDIRWEKTQASPYFNYRAKDGSIHQVWYDDPQSLTLRYQLAAEHGLQGIGFWNLDCLDYESKDKLIKQQTADMWAAVRSAVVAYSNPGTCTHPSGTCEV